MLESIASRSCCYGGANGLTHSEYPEDDQAAQEQISMDGAGPMDRHWLASPGCDWSVQSDVLYIGVPDLCGTPGSIASAFMAQSTFPYSSDQGGVRVES